MFLTRILAGIQNDSIIPPALDDLVNKALTMSNTLTDSQSNSNSQSNLISDPDWDQMMVDGALRMAVTLTSNLGGMTRIQIGA